MKRVTFFRVFLILTLFFSKAVWAVQKARIVNQDANVYSEASFDSEILFVLEKGDVFEVSDKTKGPFYRIRLKKGILAWIADNDVQILGKDGKSLRKSLSAEEPDLDSENPETLPPEGRHARKPVDEANVFGPSIHLVNFTEDTMSGVRNELMTFFGLRVLGPGRFQALNTEFQMALAFKAPGHYEKVTQRSSSGFIGLFDFSVQNLIYAGRDSLLQYGVGPLLRYSSFKTEVDGEKFQAVDLNLGAQLSLGWQTRFSSSFHLRGDVKYIFEKKSYFAAGLSFLTEY